MINKILKRIISISLIFAIVATTFSIHVAAAEDNLQSIINKNFTIRNYTTHTLLNSSAYSTSATIRTSNYNNISNYVWTFVDAGSDYVYIKLKNSSSNYILYMDSNHDIKLCMQSSSNIQSNQKKWKITSTNYGVYKITSKAYSSYAIRTSNASNNSIVYGTTGVEKIYWVFEPVANNNNTLSSVDEMAPPISSCGTERSNSYPGHKGIDIASNNISKYLFSVGDGTAVYYQSIGKNVNEEDVRCDLGNFVMLKPNNKDHVVYYGHLSYFSNGITTISVNLDEEFNTGIVLHNRYHHFRGYVNVNRGQLLGFSGKTGKASGIHLHFEARETDYISYDPNNTTQIVDILPYIGTYLSISNLDANYKLVGGLIE